MVYIFYHHFNFSFLGWYKWWKWVSYREHVVFVYLNFFKFFLIFIFTLFYFTILYWFCHTLTWIHHGCTCVPKHEPPSHLPPHNIPLGHPRAPAPSILYPALNIDWRFVSYMIVYIFQRNSPKSSHPLPLPNHSHFRDEATGLGKYATHLKSQNI